VTALTHSHSGSRSCGAKKPCRREAFTRRNVCRSGIQRLGASAHISHAIGMAMVVCSCGVLVECGNGRSGPCDPEGGDAVVVFFVARSGSQDSAHGNSLRARLFGLTASRRDHSV